MLLIRLLVVILISILTIASYTRYRDYRNPSFIYCGYWLVMLGMFSLRLWGLYDTSDTPFVCVAFGCIGFFIGSILASFLKEKRNKSFPRQNWPKAFYNKVIFVLFLISFIIFLRKDLLSFAVIMSGASIADIRYGEMFSPMEIENLIVKFIARPFSACLITIGLTQLLMGIKGGKHNTLLAGVLMLQSVLYDGVLVMFEYLFAAIFITILVFSKLKNTSYQLLTKKQFKRIKVLLLSLSILGVGGLFAAKGSVFETMYMHFCPSFNYLDARIEQMDSGRNMFTFMYTYGISTLQGIIRPVMGFFEIFGFVSDWFESATDFLLDNHEYVINVADNEQFNFFATCFAFYYKDFGLAGTILFPFILGFICERVYLEFKSNISPKSLALYIFLTSGLLLTIKVSLFSYTEIVVGLYWLFFCMCRKLRFY